MTNVIPIFPLPNVVLFPNVFLPLHIFEERYKVMMGDALVGDRIIGMVLLRKGWNRSPLTNSPVYDVGCSGLITHAKRLSDGCYNIVLQGLEKFRVVDEDDSRSYRLAKIEPIAEDEVDTTGGELRAQRRRLEHLLDQRFAATGTDSKMSRDMTDSDLVNALAQYLEFEPVEKQALLQCNGLIDRYRSLIDSLEMQILLTEHPSKQSQVQ